MTTLTRLTLIVGIVLLGILVWGLVDIARQDQAREDELETAPTTGITAPVDEFLAFADGVPGRDVPPFGLEHAYTAEGIVRLAGALEALTGDVDPRIQERLARIRQQAAELRRDPRSLEHADVVKDVFMSAAGLLGFATGQDVSRLRRIADAIDPDRRLLEQEAHVRGFFQVAADVIRSRHSPGLRPQGHYRAPS